MFKCPNTQKFCQINIWSWKEFKLDKDKMSWSVLVLFLRNEILCISIILYEYFDLINLYM